MSKVYITKNIDSENLVKLYEFLNIELEGSVAVKVHSGEPGGNHFLKPEFMKDLVAKVKGTIIEANTAYEGRRNTTEEHLKAINEHGFTKIATVDIIDSEGEIELPVKQGRRIEVNYVGSHLKDYDSLLVLSHFKGHQMGGFGGAIKNISIGIASSHGKAHIHGAGNPDKMWETEQDAFLESMAEAASTIMDYAKDNIVFINVMNNLSIDCDCNNNPTKPEMKDIGMLASIDPVALDQACLDLVYNSSDDGKKSLIERIESKNGRHTVDYAEQIGVGSKTYELINID